MNISFYQTLNRKLVWRRIDILASSAIWAGAAVVILGIHFGYFFPESKKISAVIALFVVTIVCRFWIYGMISLTRLMQDFHLQLMKDVPHPGLYDQMLPGLGKLFFTRDLALYALQISTKANEEIDKHMALLSSQKQSELRAMQQRLQDYFNSFPDSGDVRRKALRIIRSARSFQEKLDALDQLQSQAAKTPQLVVATEPLVPKPTKFERFNQQFLEEAEGLPRESESHKLYQKALQTKNHHDLTAAISAVRKEKREKTKLNEKAAAVGGRRRL